MRLTPLLGMKLHITSIPERDAMVLERSMLLMDRDTGDIYGIPAPFECDGESIPAILPETAAGDAGGAAHDFPYRFGFVYVWNAKAGRWDKRQVSRAWADELYRATCIAYTGYTWWARAKWAALRYGGKALLVWMRHRKAGKVWPGPEPEIPPQAAGGAA